jgi:pimeloyl-ACP methyl ester carboxylesterase
MTSLYADETQLRLESGTQLSAFVRARPPSSRPKCLLLHGNPGNLEDWAQLVPRLTEAADIAAIDLPGFGRSEPTGATKDLRRLDRLADHAVEALNALGWQRPVFLLGHSHGGGVAQVAAARYPARIAGIALLGTLGARVHSSYRLLALPGARSVVHLAGRMFRSRRMRAPSRLLLRRMMTDIFSPEPVPAASIEEQLALFASRPHILLSMVHVALGRPCTQLRQAARDIRCPTLFVHGGDDALVPASCARAIHELILQAGGRSHFELIPGAGHKLIAYQAAELAALIRGRLLARAD